MIALARDDGRRDPDRAKSVILLVGDGMGQAHRFAGQLAAVGLGERLLMDRLPWAGLMRTTSADPATFVTDSAAAATAMACGIKTANGAIAVGRDGLPAPTVLEIATWAGKSAGLVTTCQVTDATPAAFGAHVARRGDHGEIARQYLEESRVEVILGGGAAYWRPEGAVDLIARARRLGYDYVTSADGLEAAVADGACKLLGLFAAQELFSQRPEGEGDAYDPPVSLAGMTRAALAVLGRNPEGFFLMVEEAAIDRMAHRNNAPLTMRGVRELDAAVAVALEYAAAEPETLVIVAADHETGGLAVAGPDDPAYPYEPNGGEAAEFAGEDGPFPVAGGGQRFVLGWTTTGHTAAAVPVTAVGPGAERVVGVYENTGLFEVMVEAMGRRVRAGAG